MGPTATPVAPRLVFQPDLARRKLTGTIFYGACLAAIAVLLIALVSLLIDVDRPWSALARC